MTETEQEYVPHPTLAKLYPEVHAGGYSRMDGSVDFYTRINALVGPESRVLDFGAGRGWWAVEPIAPFQRQLRMLRGRVKEVVGSDVDPAVTTNPSLDEARVVELGAPLPFDDDSFDLVMADFVLEHINAEDAQDVANDIMRVLKPGGWFAARTPYRWGFVGIGARLIPNRRHVKVLRRLQPDRLAEDVFPVRYTMNTRKDINRYFAGHRVVVYGQVSEPQYAGRSVIAWRIAAFVERLLPYRMAAALMVFVQKTDD
jgi:SAM-dependent methyltransferase